jgi:hypothetical protein
MNAIEPVWPILHENTTNNKYYATFKKFSEKVNHFFDVIFPQKAWQWVDRLTDNFRLMQGIPMM